MPVVIQLPVAEGDTLAELREEVIARGFDYLEDNIGRVDRAINTAVSKICRQESWPFLQATGSNTAELMVGPHYGVEEVRVNGRAVQRMTRQELTSAGQDLTAAGSASCWYLDDGDTIMLAPQDSTAIITAVWRHRPEKMDQADDVCIVPVDFTDVVIDAAVRELEKDRHNWSAVQALQVEFEVQIAEMRDSLLEQQAFVPFTPGDMA